MFIALDLETTGLDPKKDKIIEVAALKVQDDGTVIDRFHSLIQPGVTLPELIVHLTGITQEDLVEAPAFSEISESLQTFIGDLPILGHSVQFDINFLEAAGIRITGAVLDTFELAQTFLPKQPSYSLEILSQKYELPHANKHRAEDDARVSIELYKLIVNRLHGLPADSKTTITPLLEKSEWAWKEGVLSALKQPGTEAAPHSPQSEKIKKSGHPELVPLVVEKLSAAECVMVEAPFYSVFDLVEGAVQTAEQSGEKILIATPHHALIEPDARVAHLHHPASYLCTARLEQLVQKPTFTSNECQLLIKVMLWKTETTHGAKHELHVGEQEHEVWTRVSALPHLYYPDCNASDCFYTRALEGAHRTPVLVVSPEFLLENGIEQHRLIPHRTHLILDAIERGEEIATDVFTRVFPPESFVAYTRELNKEDLENSFTMLFGLLGLLTEKHMDPDAFSPQIILNDTIAYTKEWSQIQATLDNIAAEIHTLKRDPSPALTLLEAKFGAFQKALTLNGNVLTWIGLRMDGTPIVRACPLEIQRLIKRFLWDHYPTLFLVSGFGTLAGSFGFLKERLALPAEMEEILLKPSPQNEGHPLLETHLDLPDANSPKNLQDTFFVIQKILDASDLNQQGVFLLTNSIKSAEQLHLKLAGSVREKGWNLMTQGMSGGLGKIIQRFEQHPAGTVLVGTHRLYDAMLKSEQATFIRTLMIHRLPFLPPSHPVHEEQSRRLNEGFMGYSLPRAILRLKHFLYEALLNCNPETIHILDPRFDNYEGRFRKSLKTLGW